ncbi:MAG: (2Fe-2S)-binding protein [Sphingopyxis sp.]|nr:(2Fe-2S)-binding protein [Sphingopyxis sp.]
MSGRFVRLAEAGRATITLFVDGVPMRSLAGDTLMTAILTARASLRRSEFGGERRAGFCLMGACQDCWIWTEDGNRLRACSTPAVDGARLCTQQPATAWPTLS